jgi:hypothetical protein
LTCLDRCHASDPQKENCTLRKTAAMRKKRKSTEASIEAVSHSVSVYIDRIENSFAVIIACDDDSLSFNLPLVFLPDDVSEGDHFILSLTPDAQHKQQTEGRVVQLQEEMTASRESQTEQTDIKL